MKVSEIIKRLSDLKEIVGDIDVWNSENDEIVTGVILDEEYYKADEYEEPGDVEKIWVE